MVKFTYTPRYHNADGTIRDGEAYATESDARRALERQGFVKAVGKKSTYYNWETKTQAIIYPEEA